VIEQKRPVEQFDVDAAILHGFHRIGYLDQLPGSGFRSGIRAISGKFHGTFGSRSRFIVNSML
jgi:hypothetical protein